MRITESQLRQIVREEASRLQEGAFSYRRKLDLIRDALDALGEAQALEMQGAMGRDDDLDKLVADLESYAEAVETMADAETNEYHSTAPVADWLKRPPGTPKDAPRSMRR